MFITSREELIEYVKRIGQYIIDNADNLVGNERRMTGIDIVGQINVDLSYPMVTVERRYRIPPISDKERIV